MSVEASAWALQQTTGSVAHKAVLLALADRANFDWECFPSQATIARETELGERTVRRLLADLEERGFIRREHRYRQNGDGGRTSDLITLTGQSGRYPSEGYRPTTTGLPAKRRGVTGQTEGGLPATGGRGTIREPIEGKEEPRTWCNASCLLCDGTGWIYPRGETVNEVAPCPRRVSDGVG